MISDNVQALAESFSRYRDSGMQLEPQGVVAVVAILNKLTAEAELIEHRGVRSWRDLFPRRKRAAPVDNVVMFPPPPWGWGNDRTTLGGDAA